MSADRTRWGWAAAGGYVAVIVAANWAIRHLGQPPPPVPGAPHTLPVWFGLDAPSGVYFVALALVLRNVVQRQLGRRFAVAAILVGALLSWWTADGHLALASGVACLCSESLDMAVYSPLQRYGQVWPVLPAALLGGALDSAVFLAIAFNGDEHFWVAQFVGKSWGVLVATFVLWAMAVRLERVEVAPA